MKLFHKAKDGGPDSKVTGYWLIESKRFFSIVLLRFDQGSREAFHTHAFNAVSFVLSGRLREVFPTSANVWLDGVVYKPSMKPIYTTRKRFHKVSGEAPVTWALSFRGPWDATWKEYLPNEQKEITLTNGRVVV